MGCSSPSIQEVAEGAAGCLGFTGCPPPLAILYWIQSSCVLILDEGRAAAGHRVYASRADEGQLELDAVMKAPYWAVNRLIVALRLHADASDLRVVAGADDRTQGHVSGLADGPGRHSTDADDDDVQTPCEQHKRRH